MAHFPFFIGVAGGSGSGKSTLVDAITEHFSHREVSAISHDNYYRDQKKKSMEDRQKTNYDHPNALETELFIQHLDTLRAGKTVKVPTYDFVHHTRAQQTITFSPTPIMIVDGILLYESAELRKRLNLKIFVDTDADIRFARRVLRDVAQRGRTFEFGIEQYLTYTRPMHLEFVEPNKRYADIIVPEGGMNAVALEVIFSHIHETLTAYAQQHQSA